MGLTTIPYQGPISCLFDKFDNIGKDEFRDVNGYEVEYADEQEIIDKLDPIKNGIYKEDITKFLGDFDDTFMDRTRPKGPDYLVIDNLEEIFGLNKDDLIMAREEAKVLSDHVCDGE